MACRALLIIAAEPSAVVTSERVAERIGGHPVVLRRVLARLRTAGLVEGRSGPGGGWAIARDPAQLSLGRVRRALKDPTSPAEGDRLARTLRAAGEAFDRELDSVTIGDLVKNPSETICN